MQGDNPIYKAPRTEYQNPAFRKYEPENPYPPIRQSSVVLENRSIREPAENPYPTFYKQTGPDFGHKEMAL